MALPELAGFVTTATSADLASSSLKIIADDPFVERVTFPKGVSEASRSASGYNVMIIVSAALVFIIVISWFEVMRSWIDYALNMDQPLLFIRAKDYFFYAIIATVVSIVLLLIIHRYWL